MMNGIVQQADAVKPVLALYCKRSECRKAAVYRIRNKANGRIYIGVTNCLSARRSQHLSKLSRGTHANSRMQDDWVQHGGHRFTMEPIKFFSNQNGFDLEIAEIQKAWEQNGRSNVYNTHCYETMKHGLSGTPTWEYWRKRRNDKNNDWPERWNDLTNLVEDIGLKPKADSQISRIDESAPHGKGNSYWDTKLERAFRVSLFTIDGETHSISDWARITGVCIATVHGRIRRGATIEEALSLANRRQKITDVDAFDIRIKNSKGVTRKELCAEYGLAKNTIRAILLGETFKDAGGPVIRKKWTKPQSP